LYVQELNTKNTGATYYIWEGILATNGAGTTVAAIGTYPNYTVGGFESRDIVANQFEKFKAIGAQVSNLNNPSKFKCEFVGIGVGTYRADVTETAGAKEFTVTDVSGNFLATGTYVRCLDPNIFNNLTTYTMRVEEIV
jgi:hypothetical protein